jgi:RNA polymerase sigma-70 factor (ECF subfamily)
MSTHVRVSASFRWNGRGVPTDESAIREFLAMRYPRLVAALALMSGSRPAAEDAVQEALARAWERGERGEHIESPEAWVRTVAVNLMRSAFRRIRAERRAREELGSTMLSPFAGTARSDDRVDVGRALAALPRRQREATILRYYLGLSVEEIAGTLGVSGGATKTTLSRARRALADSLGEHDMKEANDFAGH